MSNRNLSGNILGFEKKSVVLHGIVNIGASGAPTLQQWSGVPGSQAYSAAPTNGFAGIKSVTRTGTGTYVVTLQDTYVRLLAFWVGFQKDSAAAAPNTNPKSTGTNVSSLSSPQITFVCYNSAGTATDPASGEVMYLEIELHDSTAI